MNSSTLEWLSDEYIGRGTNIKINSTGPRDNVTSIGNPTTYATLVSVINENGITVTVSQLFITASEEFPTASVTCQLDGHSARSTISFNTTKGKLWLKLKVHTYPVSNIIYRTYSSLWPVNFFSV